MLWGPVDEGAWGAREKMDALGLQCAEKATMIVVLSWLAGGGGGGGLSERRLRLRLRLRSWWLWPESGAVKQRG